MPDPAAVPTRPPLPVPGARSLEGLTVLLIEDSRLASEALRLVCRRMGARVRRADSLAAAARHLAIYRPDLALVDPGLPDGSGLDLVARLARGRPPARRPALLVLSGDPAQEPAARAAGADGFLGKPLPPFATVEGMLLAALGRPQPPAARPGEPLPGPDPLALADDLARAAALLEAADDAAAEAHAAQFSAALAALAGDPALASAARAALASRGPAATVARSALAALVARRLARTPRRI